MVIKKKLLLFKIEKSLGKLEADVMDVIWGKDKVTVREVVNILRRNRKIAYTTVMTVMDNLYKKGFVTREKIKKSYLYFPTLKENYVVDFSLSKVFKDLTRDYGRRKVIYLTINSTLIAFPTLKIISSLSDKAMKIYKAPVGLGLSFTLIVVLFSFSALDLFQNLTFFGTIDYLGLLISEPALLVGRLHLLIPAFLESLPIVNILTTAISFTLIIVLAKKLSKLIDLRRPTIIHLGGAI